MPSGIVKRPQRPRKAGLAFSSTRNSSITTAFLEQHISPELSLPELSFPTDKISLKILTLSDTHGLATFANSLDNYKDIDVVLHCGDLSECGAVEDYENTIALLDKISAPLKLIIPGNHDLTLDSAFWSSRLGNAEIHKKALQVWEDAKANGNMLLQEGIHEFTIRGAKLRIYVSPYTRNSDSVDEWAFGYESAEDRFNPPQSSIAYGVPSATTEGLIDGDIDIIMTHGPAKYRLDMSSSNESLGCAHLFRALRRIKPKMHVFGHVHNAYGAELVQWKSGKTLPSDDDVDDGIERQVKVDGLEDRGARRIGLVDGPGTLFINAATMGDGGKLTNLPWIVDIELSKVQEGRV